MLSGAGVQDSLTDAFSFAVLAFQILVLAHPLIGDAVYRDPGRLEPLAFRGDLPWIDHPTNDGNRSSQGLDRGLVLTKGCGGWRRGPSRTGCMTLGSGPRCASGMRSWIRQRS